jgi:hypothetical protein
MAPPVIARQQPALSRVLGMRNLVTWRLCIGCNRPARCAKCALLRLYCILSQRPPSAAAKRSSAGVNRPSARVCDSEPLTAVRV